MSDHELLESIDDKLGKILKFLESNKFFETPVNNYGETIGEAIQMQIIRGNRGIDIT